MFFAGNTYAQIPDTTDNAAPSYTQPIPNTVPKFATDPANPGVEVKRYLQEKLNEYEVYKFEFSGLNDYLTGNMHALEFDLGSTFLSLQRKDIRAADYMETETLENGETVTTYKQDLDGDSLYEVHTVMGFANRNKSLIARLSIEPNNLTGYIWNTESNHVLYYTSLQDFIKSNRDGFNTDENYLLVFDLGAIKGDPNARCSALEAAVSSGPQAKGYFDQCAPRFLEIAAEGDKPWCDAYGGAAAGKILENLFL